MSALRAVGRAIAWPVRRLRRVRLRAKLALSLSVAALVPMLLVAVLASGVVFGNLGTSRPPHFALAARPGPGLA